MGMKYVLIAVLSIGCAAIPEPSAEKACHDLFDAWTQKVSTCKLTTAAPDKGAVCPRAYNWDKDELEGVCLPWITDAPCSELGNESFQAHCSKSVFLRTW
jgi:hypothetical protein